MNEIARREDNLPAVTPMALLQRAVESGIDASSIETLAKLAWEQQERDAATMFADRFREFRAACPPIVKSKRVAVATKRGSDYSYFYAPLDEITRVVDPILHRLGFSYSWTSRIEGGLMVVSCRLRHDAGHEESADFVAPLASGSPTMSEIQKHASSMTYARRQALIAVLGLTTADTDTDAGDDLTFVTPEQAAQLRDLAEHPNVDTAAFLRWVGADDFEDIRAGQYETARNALLRKRSAT